MRGVEHSDICIFGEVLFDHFPGGEAVLGGAPFNVAWHLQAFGQSPFFISRVGADGEGSEVKNAMAQWGMDTAGLQTDPARPTGRVSVNIMDGEPHYDIVENCAYDAIDVPAVSSCDFLYHGSLATRSACSRRALKALRDLQPQTVFIDVNLRPPWWQAPQLLELLAGAHWVKLNSAELAELQGSDKRAAAWDFLQRFDLRGLIITLGAKGAEILLANGDHAQVASSPDIDVVDTVGAGDAFASIVVLGLIEDWPVEQTLQRAQQFAETMVTKRGATVASKGFYEDILNAWKVSNAGGGY